MFLLLIYKHKFLLLNLSFPRDNFEEGFTDFLLKICIREPDKPSAEKHTKTECPLKGQLSLEKSKGHLLRPKARRHSGLFP